MAALQRLENAELTLPERQWRAAIGAGWPTAVLATPALVAFNDLPICAFRHLTGHPCPLCGGTHACAALVQGDFLAAWYANPGALPLLILASAHAVVLLGESLAGRQLGLELFWTRAWTGAGLLLLAGWGLRLANVV